MLAWPRVARTEVDLRRPFFTVVTGSRTSATPRVCPACHVAQVWRRQVLTSVGKRRGTQADPVRATCFGSSRAAGGATFGRMPWAGVGASTGEAEASGPSATPVGEFERRQSARLAAMRDGEQFDGGVFSAVLEGGRAGARLSVRPDGVHATTAEGATFHLPYAQCQLELGGASGRMWFCRSPDRSLTLFSESRGFAEALRARSGGALGPALARIEGAARASSRRTALGWLVCLAVLAVIVLGGYYGVRGAGSAAIDFVPRAVDVQLGKLASEHLPTEGRPVDDPVVTGAVREVVDRLAAHTTRDFSFQVRVLEAPLVNAFALPGGYIVVYTGLVRAAESPEQLAGVLAHEMAHVTLRHGMRRIAQSVGVVAAIQLLLGDVSGLAAVAVELLREGALNSYSREQESEADSSGVRVLAAAGVDPRALADFFALLQRREPGLPAVIGWLGTHPDLGARVESVRREAARTKIVAPHPFSLRWAEVQQHAAPRSTP